MDQFKVALNYCRQFQVESNVMLLMIYRRTIMDLFLPIGYVYHLNDASLNLIRSWLKEISYKG